MGCGPGIEVCERDSEAKAVSADERQTEIMRTEKMMKHDENYCK